MPSTDERGLGLAEIRPPPVRRNKPVSISLPDPSSQQACTVGGNVANNSGGPHCLAEGVTSAT